MSIIKNGVQNAECRMQNDGLSYNKSNLNSQFPVPGCQFHFRPVEIGDIPLYYEYIAANAGYREYYGCELFPQTLLTWGGGKIGHFVTPDAIYIVDNYKTEPLFFPPVVKSIKYFPAAVGHIRDYCRQNGIAFTVDGVWKPLAFLEGMEEYTVTDSRDLYDYLYLPENLSGLPGGDYKKKRNFISQFLREYPAYTLQSYTPADRAPMLKMLDEWNAEHYGADGAERDRQAVVFSLKNLDALRMFCDVLKCGTEILAFAIGYLTPNNAGVVAFERALNHSGCYAMINKLFAARHFSGVAYVNRQEDMGVAGLRQAKLSYHPSGFVEKLRIIVNQVHNRT